MKTIAQCIADEVKNYFTMYFDTVDLLTDAKYKYAQLEKVAASVSKASDYRALALEAERNLELLKNRRRKFMENRLPINPPDQPLVDKTKELAAALASLLAKEAQASAIIDIAIKGLDAFNKVSEA
jgi:hypothetical protein